METFRIFCCTVLKLYSYVLLLQYKICNIIFKRILHLCQVQKTERDGSLWCFSLVLLKYTKHTIHAGRKKFSRVKDFARGKILHGEMGRKIR